MRRRLQFISMNHSGIQAASEASSLQWASAFSLRRTFQTRRFATRTNSFALRVAHNRSARIRAGISLPGRLLWHCCRWNVSPSPVTVKGTPIATEPVDEELNSPDAGRLQRVDSARGTDPGDGQDIAEAAIVKRKQTPARSSATEGASSRFRTLPGRGFLECQSCPARRAAGVDHVATEGTFGPSFAALTCTESNPIL